MRAHAVLRRLVRVFAMAAFVCVVAPAATASAAQPGTGLGATLRPTADGALGASWRSVLASSKNLGPSRAAHSGVIARLRDNSEPRALEQFAAAAGLRVSWKPGDDWAVVNGPALLLGRALHVTIDEFRAPNGRTFYAATAQAHSPTPDVASLGSIDSYGRFVPLDVPNGGLTPSGLLQAYDAAPLAAQGYEGQGETIVFFEIDGYRQSNLDSFATTYHLPAFTPAAVGGQAGPPQGETELDLEVAHAVAPQARLVYFNFSAANSAASMESEFAQVAAQYPGAIWSMSLGACETEWGFNGTDFATLEAVLEKAEAGGTTIFVSSGDEGGLECTPPGEFGHPPQNSFVGVSLPADFPAVVGVGGTRLSVTTSGAYAGEQAWTEPLLSQGSGGGISLFERPTYQVGPGTGVFGSAQPGRQVPDVAAIADPATGAAVYENGSPGVEGGTSLAAPVWAGFMTLIDQYLAHQGLRPVGWANSDLYDIAAQAQLYPPFHDITQGGNAETSATPGYDMVTGLGSPDVWNLARDLAHLMGK
jgi:kumamolisin